MRCIKGTLAWRICCQKSIFQALRCGAIQVGNRLKHRRRNNFKQPTTPCKPSDIEDFRLGFRQFPLSPIPTARFEEQAVGVNTILKDSFRFAVLFGHCLAYFHLFHSISPKENTTHHDKNNLAWGILRVYSTAGLNESLHSFLGDTQLQHPVDFPLAFVFLSQLSFLVSSLAALCAAETAAKSHPAWRWILVPAGKNEHRNKDLSLLPRTSGWLPSMRKESIFLKSYCLTVSVLIIPELLERSVLT